MEKNVLKKSGKTIVFVVCVLLLLTFGILSFQRVQAASPTSLGANAGRTFEAGVAWITKQYYAKEILTYEATICLPKNISDRGGVILGNYSNVKQACYNFEIYYDGNPRFYVDYGTGGFAYRFTDVDVCTGEWIHLTIVRDMSARKMHCYVDGQLKQSLDMKTSDTGKLLPKTIAGIGCDLRPNNGQYFKGRIADIKLYSDVRTQSEIVSDIQSVDKSNLIAGYDFTNKELTGTYHIYDIGANDYNISMSKRWMDWAPTIEDYDYSFAIVGDPQYVCMKYPENMNKIYKYIADNINDKKIKYVFTMGDSTEKDGRFENGVDYSYEWPTFSAAAHQLDGKVPYSILRGNHDGSNNLNKYFPLTNYSNGVGGTYNGKIENSWQTIKVGNIKYLMMSLDVGAADPVLEWASEVIDEHADYNVIIATHAYLWQDGSWLVEDGPFPITHAGGVNEGDELWDKLFSQHSNIVMVLCGHTSPEQLVMREDIGVHGNVVKSMVIDGSTLDYELDGGAGLVAMLYFSDEGRKVQVEYYSTISNQWFLGTNQFTFDLNVVDGNGNKEKSENQTSDKNVLTDNSNNSTSGQESSANGESNQEEQLGEDKKTTQQETNKDAPATDATETLEQSDESGLSIKWPWITVFAVSGVGVIAVILVVLTKRRKKEVGV